MPTLSKAANVSLLEMQLAEIGQVNSQTLDEVALLQARVDQLMRSATRSAKSAGRDELLRSRCFERRKPLLFIIPMPVGCRPKFAVRVKQDRSPMLQQLRRDEQQAGQETRAYVLAVDVAQAYIRPGDDTQFQWLLAISRA